FGAAQGPVPYSGVEPAGRLRRVCRAPPGCRGCGGHAPVGPHKRCAVVPQTSRRNPLPGRRRLADLVPWLLLPASSSRPDSRRRKTETRRRNFPPATDDNGSAVRSLLPAAPGSSSATARPNCGTPRWAESENGSGTPPHASARVVVRHSNRSNGPALPTAARERQNRTRPASRVRSRPDNGSVGRPTVRRPADVPGSSVRSRCASGFLLPPGSTPVRQSPLPHPARLPVRPPAPPTAEAWDRPFLRFLRGAAAVGTSLWLPIPATPSGNHPSDVVRADPEIPTARKENLPTRFANRNPSLPAVDGYV